MRWREFIVLIGRAVAAPSSHRQTYSALSLNSGMRSLNERSLVGQIS
jgi:hypothetical protein